MEKSLEYRNKSVSLHCVFHSIRFKVNKGLGHSGDPFFMFYYFLFFFLPNRKPYPFISFRMRRKVSTAIKPLLTKAAI